MTEQEKQALLDKEALLTEIKSLISDSTKESVTEKVLNTRIDAINKKIEDTFKSNEDVLSLKESVDKLIQATGDNAAAIKAMSETANKPKETGKTKSFRQALEDAIMEKKECLSEKNDDNGKRLSLKDYFDKGNKTSPTFTMKAVDMLESNIVQTNVATVRLSELDPQRVGVPLTIYPHVMDWMPSKGITRPYMSVLVVYDYSDGAGTKTEGSAPTQSSFLLKTVEFKAFYIATYGTLSDETLDDLPEVLDEISMVFPDKIMDNIDSQILGTAGNDTSAIAGMFTSTKHTDYSGTAYAAAVAGGNMIDLIGIMAAQVKASKYRPDSVIMNPVEVEKLAQLKDLLNNSISDRRISFDAMGRPTYVSGLRIYETSGITADTMAVVDSKQLIIGKRKEMTLEIGFNGTDLTEGQKTVVVKVRVAFAVRDKLAVVYSAAVATDTDAIIAV